MQKFNEPCIKTGDFARLCNTNKRTLFHYDEIGLFSPARTDEKGYRYYSESQADVFFTISCLKDIGMPLKEIRSYINDRNPSDLERLLLEQQERVSQELAHLNRIRQVISTKLALLETGAGIRFEGRLSEVVLEKMPDEYLVVSPRLDTDDHEALFEAVCQHIGYCNHENINTGNPYGAILSVDALGRNEQDTYAHFCTKVSSVPEKVPYQVKPAGNYAAVYLKGDYYDAAEAYKKLLGYCDRYGFCPGEFCYKEAVWDELASAREKDYITKISVRVE